MPAWEKKEKIAEAIEEARAMAKSPEETFMKGVTQMFFLDSMPSQYYDNSIEDNSFYSPYYLQ